MTGVLFAIHQFVLPVILTIAIRSTFPVLSRFVFRFVLPVIPQAISPVIWSGAVRGISRSTSRDVFRVVFQVALRDTFLVVLQGATRATRQETQPVASGKTQPIREFGSNISQTGKQGLPVCRPSLTREGYTWSILSAAFIITAVCSDLNPRWLIAPGSHGDALPVFCPPSFAWLSSSPAQWNGNGHQSTIARLPLTADRDRPADSGSSC